MDPDSSTQRHHSWLRPVAAFVLLIVMYLASLGPICLLVSRGLLDVSTADQIFHSAYYPLAYVDDHSEFFQENPVGMAYAWYVEHWTL